MWQKQIHSKLVSLPSSLVSYSSTFCMHISKFHVSQCIAAERFSFAQPAQRIITFFFSIDRYGIDVDPCISGMELMLTHASLVWPGLHFSRKASEWMNELSLVQQNVSNTQLTIFVQVHSCNEMLQCTANKPNEMLQCTTRNIWSGWLIQWNDSTA